MDITNAFALQYDRICLGWNRRCLQMKWLQDPYHFPLTFQLAQKVYHVLALSYF